MNSIHEIRRLYNFPSKWGNKQNDRNFNNLFITYEASKVEIEDLLGISGKLILDSDTTATVLHIQLLQFYKIITSVGVVLAS